MTLDAGTVLGSYRILRPLGRGGMGCVYEAEHVALRVRRALKVFSSESEHGTFLRRRFVAEGRILAALDHPRIVRVYDFAVDGRTGAPYFAMDLVLSPSGEPRTLEDVCREGVEEAQVVSWFRDVCEGLAYIHAQGVVHRDVSLDNILIGSDGRAVITDFGIAKITGGDYLRRFDITRTVVGRGVSMGKGLYMAPELRQGEEATPASDAYALGVLLFRLLEGSWYTPETRLAEALAGMDWNWDAVIGRLCAAVPSERLGADGMAGAAACLHPCAVPPPRRRVVPRVRTVLAVAAVAVVLGLLAVLLRRGDGDAPASERVDRRIVTNVVHQIVKHDVTNIVHQIVPHAVTSRVWQVIQVTNRVEAARP